jgi:sulfopyruvate decarboxylase TPP-binding subunit
MRTAHEFWDLLKIHELTFFSGVPCSLLESVINVGLADPAVTYIPAVREDVALGIASAAHLSGRRGGDPVAELWARQCGEPADVV